LKQPTQRVPPIRRADQTRAHSNRGKGNTTSGHSDIQTELPQNEAFKTEINKALNAHYQQPITFLTPKKTQNIIKEGLKSWRVFGCDLITGIIL
jgi:hypothetical protein